ncbi:MAG: tetratricopeptide repeat protein [Theionarchaea archaeon]|nr:tetratricopeptide repeat protein [Theionarchaea archaeon]
MKKYDEAEKHYRKALKIDPNFASAHNSLILLLIEMDRHDDAREQYKEALKRLG